jgi:hypothetical protein
MRLVMLQEKDVYGKRVKVGEEFEVPDNEAVTWIKIGFARAANAPSRGRQPTVLVQDPPLSTRGGGRYRRSDMRSEDE